VRDGGVILPRSRPTGDSITRRLVASPTLAHNILPLACPGSTICALLTMELVPWFTFQPMSDKRQTGPLRAGELAQMAGVSKDTLRHYERKGLLASRRASNGYRKYESQALGRVHLVRRALSVGITLDELARVVKIRDGGGRPCREVRALAAAKLESLEGRLRDLTLLRNQLREMLGEWDAKLARTPRGKPARLLESWAQESPEREKSRAAAALSNGRRGRSASRRQHRRRIP